MEESNVGSEEELYHEKCWLKKKRESSMRGEKLNTVTNVFFGNMEEQNTYTHMIYFPPSQLKSIFNLDFLTFYPLLFLAQESHLRYELIVVMSPKNFQTVTISEIFLIF